MSWNIYEVSYTHLDTGSRELVNTHVRARTEEIET